MLWQSLCGFVIILMWVLSLWLSDILSSSSDWTLHWNYSDFQLNYSTIPLYSSQNRIVTDGQSVSKSWCGATSGAHDQIFLTQWQLRSCSCAAPSLTRGRVCLLYMLLVLASAVILGSESLGTRDHILVSQIWDFPFRRLLRSTLLCVLL
jgi:hypothetical protein